MITGCAMHTPFLLHGQDSRKALRFPAHVKETSMKFLRMPDLDLKGKRVLIR